MLQEEWRISSTAALPMGELPACQLISSPTQLKNIVGTRRKTSAVPFLTAGTRSSNSSVAANWTVHRRSVAPRRLGKLVDSITTPAALTRITLNTDSCTHLNLKSSPNLASRLKKPAPSIYLCLRCTISGSSLLLGASNIVCLNFLPFEYTLS